MPSRGVAYGSGLEPAPHLVGERARGLGLLEAGGLVAISAAALVERVPPRERRAAALHAERGGELVRDEAVAALVAAGYSRVERVGDRGDLAVRGDILDVFPTTGAEPVRIELFGDEVERISRFSVFTQRSLAELERCDLQPAREARRAPADVEEWTHEEDVPVPNDLVSLAPELIAHGVVCAWQPDRVLDAARDRLAEAAASHSRSARERAYVGEGAVVDLLEGVTALDTLQGDTAFDAQRPALAGRGISEAEAELLGLVRSGLRVVVAFPHRGDAERTQLALRRVDASLLAQGQPLPDEAGVVFAVSPLRRGVVWPTARLAVVSAQQLFRRRAAGAAVAGRLGRALSSAADLRPDDYVVHVEHGVGRFLGFDTKTVGGVTRDYVNLQFKGEDRLFVPHDQLAKLSRYIGADGRPPALSKLGGKAWHTLRSRARAAVHELAGELLRLYAVRQTRTPAALRRRGGLARAHGARVRLHRDRGSGPRDRRGARGSHERAADGPPDLRRRRLRQDRGGDARGLPGCHLGPPGARARADDPARAAAPADVPRPLPRLSGARRGRLAHARRRGGQAGAAGVQRGQDRGADRHPPRALARRRSPSSSG